MNRLICNANEDVIKQYLETDIMPECNSLSFFRDAYNTLNNIFETDKTARAALMSLDKEQLKLNDDGSFYWPKDITDKVDKVLANIYNDLVKKYGSTNSYIASIDDLVYYHMKSELIRRLYTKFFRVYQEAWPEVKKKIFKTIIKKVKTIAPNINFKQNENGFYEHTWLDSYKFERDEALPVLDYIAEHKDVSNEILNEALNMDVDTFNKVYIPWDQYINLLKQNTYACERLHLKVRDYIIELNRDVVKDKFDSINNLQDKIVNINENGDIVDEEGNVINDKPGVSLKLDFNPREDSQREKPIIVLRTFDKDSYSDHVIIGNRGANHDSIFKAKKYQDLIQKSIKDGNPVFAACYLVGTIAIIDNQRNLFPSLNELINVLKESHKFTKIYVMRAESRDNLMYRLAWKKKSI